ncbi:GH25 family lysozyme [Paracoccaceae bacterium]
MIRSLVLASLALTLAACAARAPAPKGAPPAFHVTVSDFGDAHPVDWAGQAPRSHPVHGIDVSVWQGDIDWSEARTHGVNFAFIKATEGGDRVDPAFARHWAGAAAAGVPRGAYHFFYHCRPAIEQARWFIAHVPRRAGALPPVLDMEWNPHSPTCSGKRPVAEVQAEARTFLRALTAHYGQRPILYTTVDFYEENRLWEIGGVDFWLRSTAAHPSDRYPGQHWLIWQYSGTGLVPGIKGKVDLNAFAGDRRDFSAWLAAQN